MAEELADVRGGLPEASSKSDHDLAIHRSLEEKGLTRYKNKVEISIKTDKPRKSLHIVDVAGQPGLLDEPPASDRATSLNSSLLPVRPSSHTSRSLQLILAKVFGQLPNQDCFYEHLLSFVRRSLPAWRGVVLYRAMPDQC